MFGRFKYIVGKFGNRTAIDICRTTNPIRYTYTELNKYTNRLAHYINANEKRPPDSSKSRIVCLDDAPERVIPSFLSIMKLGAVYGSLRRDKTR